jgi:hypothetical protein
MADWDVEDAIDDAITMLSEVANQMDTGIEAINRVLESIPEHEIGEVDELVAGLKDTRESFEGIRVPSRQYAIGMARSRKAGRCVFCGNELGKDGYQGAARDHLGKT